jgi:2-keto-4-pentenoate hydratase/2-oxohepta-3-ene-1,7-dioic acid hydratase in catechol pathway
VRIVRYQAGSAPAWGVVEGDDVRATVGSPFIDLEPTGRVGALAELELLAPVTPRTVMCVGRNFRDHAAEFGNEVPTRPLLFLKPPASVTGPAAPIIHPRETDRVDPEAELVVVIGRPASHVRREDAWSVIGGYTVGNDVSARDLQRDDPGGQWTRAKGFDTFCPIGPWVDTDFDPTAARVTCAVGGELRQEGTLDQLIFSIPDLIAHVTAFTRLDVGDVLMTGTPAGVRRVVVGDRVTCAVDGLGSITNEIVPAP